MTGGGTKDGSFTTTTALNKSGSIEQAFNNRFAEVSRAWQIHSLQSLDIWIAKIAVSIKSDSNLRPMMAHTTFHDQTKAECSLKFLEELSKFVRWFFYYHDKNSSGMLHRIPNSSSSFFLRLPSWVAGSLSPGKTILLIGPKSLISKDSIGSSVFSTSSLKRSLVGLEKLKILLEYWFSRADFLISFSSKGDDGGNLESDPRAVF